MEETWQAVFRNLYTGFLLRDFAGKIVPGVYLLFSVASMFRSLAGIIREIRKDVPVFALRAWVVWNRSPEKHPPIARTSGSRPSLNRLFDLLPVCGQT